MAEHRFVEHLPDLIQPEEYAADPAGKRIRIQIRVTERGVEILGDAVRPLQLEAILEELGAAEIEQMLCG